MWFNTAGHLGQLNKLLSGSSIYAEMTETGTEMNGGRLFISLVISYYSLPVPCPYTQLPKFSNNPRTVNLAFLSTCNFSE